MRRLKKYASGEAAQYITRKQALKKLQLSLNDFRRLCIIKGIYPREPKNRRRAQKGDSNIRILYHTKDIRFLLHEPIVWTLRDYKIFYRRTGRDRAIRDFRNLKRRMDNHPSVKIDHIVKERYPTFMDAIRDLDDCLSLLFLFSTFPSLKHVPRDQSALCRRLTIEFMHAVIASNSLQKVFISIKGYYFQAEIKGQKVTWIIPHYYPFTPQAKSDVDFKVMSIFVEFYTIMLGFVNFRLFNANNLIYPPQFPDSLTADAQDEQSFVSERIAALTADLTKQDPSIVEEEEEELDLELLATEGGDTARVQEMKDEANSQRKLRTLFKGLKFFINREVPREPLVFIIRCFGGKISWDKSIFVGATFDENDETVTHQIIDRPNIGKQYISRDYIQPQWIFDCVNQRQLLPTNKYFIGAVLPPHLSPFVDPEREGAYIPPEELALRDPSLIEIHNHDDENQSADEDDKMNSVELDNELEQAYRDEKADAGSDDEGSDDDDDDEEDDDDDDDQEMDEEQKQELKLRKKEAKKKMAVKSGELHKENPFGQFIEDQQEHKLTARMVKGRHRNLFRKLVREKIEKRKERKNLEVKRTRIEGDGKKKKSVK